MSAYARGEVYAFEAKPTGNVVTVAIRNKRFRIETGDYFKLGQQVRVYVIAEDDELVTVAQAFNQPLNLFPVVSASEDPGADYYA